MRLITRFASVSVVVACAAFTGGCLVKETTHTVCLEADGSASWIALEQRVHAVADTPADRLREEQEFLTAARTNNHSMAQSLRTLGGLDVSTTVVSARWPYAVATEARFPNIATLFQAMLGSTDEVRGRSALERIGDRVKWTIVVDYDPTAGQAGAEGQSSPVAEATTTLMSDMGDRGPILVIQHGQFVDAVGFTIEDDGRVAKMDDLSKRDWEKEPHLEMSLTWSATELVSVKKAANASAQKD